MFKQLTHPKEKKMITIKSTNKCLKINQKESITDMKIVNIKLESE